MAHLLKNDLLEIYIDLPTENYQHSRFDWTGKIAAVTYKGKTLSGTEVADQDEAEPRGKGFYNEFGIDSPIGYSESNAGAWFHKIGVGLLKKDDAYYNFHKPYDIRPLEFELSLDPDNIRINCQSPVINGYSYFLHKEISLLKSGFAIRYLLKNTGAKPISTNEYNHNFLSIGNDLIGTHYILKFPFQIRPDLFGETVNPEQLVEIGQQEITFRGTPEKQFFFSNLSGGEIVKANWTLENTATKLGLSETGDFQTRSINLWGWRHVICPELFIDLHLQPAQSANWTRTYEVFEII